MLLFSRGDSIRDVLLFPGGGQKGCHYSKGTFIRGVLLFEGCHYSRGASIRRVLLFEACFYSRGGSI